MNRLSSSCSSRPSAPVWAALFVVLLGLSPAPVRSQVLWREDASRSMFADKRARNVGDLVTVVISENTSSSKQNSTKTAKQSAIDAAINSFLFSPQASGFLTKGGKMPAVNLAGKTSFEGGGQINNTEQITARCSVQVIDTLPNGNLVIEGTKKTQISGETTDAFLRGIVRSEDVTAANTVFSYQIMDATIQYKSKGVVSDSQRKGWFMRLWDKFMPF